jgi:hypothetical protein
LRHWPILRLRTDPLPEGDAAEDEFRALHKIRSGSPSGKDLAIRVIDIHDDRWSDQRDPHADELNASTAVDAVRLVQVGANGRTE